MRQTSHQTKERAIRTIPRMMPYRSVSLKVERVHKLHTELRNHTELSNQRSPLPSMTPSQTLIPISLPRPQVPVTRICTLLGRARKGVGWERQIRTFIQTLHKPKQAIVLYRSLCPCLLGVIWPFHTFEPNTCEPLKWLALGGLFRPWCDG